MRTLTESERQLIRDSGLFDAVWYAEKYPDVGATGLDPLDHFLRIGIYMGREPGPLFDSKHYCRQLEQISYDRNSESPLVDYLSQGWKAGLNPNPFFDVSFYLENNPDVATAGLEPLGHFIRFGSFEKRNPHPIFDIAFYLDKNPDVAQSGVGPLQHFVLNGLHEGRSPNADFNPKEYLALNPDVARANLPAALHYATHGLNENRKINNAHNSIHSVYNGINYSYCSRPWILHAGPNRLRALGEKIGLSSLAPSISLTQEFENHLRSVQLVSFDLFDTLVERVVSEPTEVFRIAAIKVGCYDPELFRAKRIQAETLARKSSKHSEVTFDEIYHELSILTGFDSDELIRYKNEEISTEMSILRPRPVGRAMFDAAYKTGIPIVISTDMYLPETVVQQILSHTGYTGWNKLLVSSKLRRTKHEGGLFDTLQKSHNISADKILHVGDNSHSDDFMPRRLGFRSLLIRRTWDEFQADVRRQAAWPEKDGISVLPSILRGLVARQFGLASAASNHTEGWLGNPHLIGYGTLGPVLIGFCTWLASSAQARGIKTLWFLSRDGFYLKAAYDLLATAHPEWPRSRYVAASRALCWTAVADSPDRVMEVARVDHFPMAICDLLKNRFGYSSKDIDEIPDDFFNRSGLSGRQAVVNQEDPAKFKFIEIIAPEIIRRSAIAREDYRSYLAGLDCPHTAAVVDIGYSGSSQKVISRLLGTKVDGFYMITSERAASLSSEELFADAWIAQHAPLDHPFFQKVQLWELLLSGTHGSVIGTPNGSGFILDDNILDEESRAYLALIHKGAIDLVNDVITNFGVKTIEPLTAVEATRPLNEWFKNPAACDVIPLSRIIFEDRFGGAVRALIVSRCNSQYDGGGCDSIGIWQEADLACANDPFVMTPFWPAGPIACARAAGRLKNRNKHLVMDELTISGDILAASDDLDFSSVFDSIGTPYQAKNKPINLLFPVEVIDARFEVAAASIRMQIAPGFCIHVALFPGVDKDRALEIIGPVAGCLEVKNASEMIGLVRNIPNHEMLALHDGRSIVTRSAAIELLAASLEGAPDLISVDEDEAVDATRSNPHFKPSWSPEMLRCTDYLGGLWAVKSGLLKNLAPEAVTVRGWMWDLALSISDLVEKPRHLPRVLASRDAKWDQQNANKVQSDAERAVMAKFVVEGQSIDVRRPDWSVQVHKPVVLPVFPDDGPRVAIIIPTRNGFALIKRCIESLMVTTYKNYTVYIIDNESDDPQTLKWLANLNNSRLHVIRISSPDTGFSYSYINNRAVEQTRGEELLLFLNNDTSVIEPRWLSQMVGWQAIKGVGSVGALLFYENDLVMHAGITKGIGLYMLPLPSLKLLPRGVLGYQDYIGLVRNSAAQTAACLLTPRSVFLDEGGFDEKDFSVAYNDCDYGFKLVNKGLRNVYSPDSLLYHYEGLTRGRGRGNDKPSEEAAFVRKYAEWTDPYYNVNLGISGTDFAIRPASVASVSAPKLRLAVVTHNLNYEGAPLVLLELVKGLVGENCSVPLVISLNEGPLRALYENIGAEVIVTKEPVFSVEKNIYNSAIKNIAEIMAARSISVLFANTVLCWWAVEAAFRVGIPSIWCIHESEPPFTHLLEHGQALAARGVACLGYAYRVVFPAWETQRVWKHLEEHNNFHVNHYGFDLKEYQNRSFGISREQARSSLCVDKNKIVAILPGTVCERKSQKDLIQAVKNIDLETIRCLHIFIVGDVASPYSTQLHELHASLDPVRRDSVTIIPHCKDMERFFMAADFMISTSRVEAFPKIVQEAMFYSLPMVLAPVFGIIEQVQDEVSALFFPPGDFLKLAEQITRIVHDAKLRLKLGGNARVSLDRLPTIDEKINEYHTMIVEAWLSV